MKFSADSSCSSGPSMALKVKLGRPTKSSLTEMTALTEDERKHKRRMANRDSARRMRARRLDNLDWLAKQVQILEDKCDQLESENEALTNGCKKLQDENQRLNQLVEQLPGSKTGKASPAVVSTNPVPTNPAPEVSSAFPCISAGSSVTDEQLCPITLLALSSPSITAPLASTGMSARTDISSPCLNHASPNFSVSMDEDTSLPGILAAGCDPLAHTPTLTALPSPHNSSTAANVQSPLAVNWSTQSNTVASPTPAALSIAPKQQVQQQQQPMSMMDACTTALFDELSSFSSTSAGAQTLPLGLSQTMDAANQALLTELTSSTMNTTFSKPFTSTMNTTFTRPFPPTNNSVSKSFPTPSNMYVGYNVNPNNNTGTWNPSGSAATMLPDSMACLHDPPCNKLNLVTSLPPQLFNARHPTLQQDSGVCQNFAFPTGATDSAWNLRAGMLPHKHLDLSQVGGAITMQFPVNSSACSELGAGHVSQMLQSSSNGFMGFSDEGMATYFPPMSTMADLEYRV